MWFSQKVISLSYHTYTFLSAGDTHPRVGYSGLCNQPLDDHPLLPPHCLLHCSKVLLPEGLQGNEETGSYRSEIWIMWLESSCNLTICFPDVEPYMKRLIVYFHFEAHVSTSFPLPAHTIQHVAPFMLTFPLLYMDCLPSGHVTCSRTPPASTTNTRCTVHVDMYTFNIFSYLAILSACNCWKQLSSAGLFISPQFITLLLIIYYLHQLWIPITMCSMYM